MDKAASRIRLHSQNELCANFKDLLSRYPEVDTNAMGFPQGWENEPLWRL